MEFGDTPCASEAISFASGFSRRRANTGDDLAEAYHILRCLVLG